MAVAWPLITWATVEVYPDMLAAFVRRPFAWLAALGALLGIAAFLGTSGLVGGLLVATAATTFPVMLRAVPDATRSITATSAGGDAAGLRTALGWWVIGFPIAIGYLVLLLRLHRGKAMAPKDGEGY